MKSAISVPSGLRRPLIIRIESRRCKIKMVIEVLEGIHYAALEAISLCTKAGIHPRIVHDISSNAAGNSWIFKNYVPQLLNDAENAEIYYPEQLAKQVSSKSKTVSRIGFIGLGAMGVGMATHLLKSNLSIAGSDVYEPSLKRFENAGGLVGRTPAEVAKANETQAESVLYGEFGAVSALPCGASIILSSTVSPGFLMQLEQRLQSKGLQLIDVPVLVVLRGGFRGNTYDYGFRD